MCDSLHFFLILLIFTKQLFTIQLNTTGQSQQFQCTQCFELSTITIISGHFAGLPYLWVRSFLFCLDFFYFNLILCFPYFFCYFVILLLCMDFNYPQLLDLLGLPVIFPPLPHRLLNVIVSTRHCFSSVSIYLSFVYLCGLCL